MTAAIADHAIARDCRSAALIRRQPEHRAAARTATARTRRQKGAHPGGRKKKSG